MTFLQRKQKVLSIKLRRDMEEILEELRRIQKDCRNKLIDLDELDDRLQTIIDERIE